MAQNNLEDNTALSVLQPSICRNHIFFLLLGTDTEVIVEIHYEK